MKPGTSIAPLAQLAEQISLKDFVASSTPTWSTTFPRCSSVGFEKKDECLGYDHFNETLPTIQTIPNSMGRTNVSGINSLLDSMDIFIFEGAENPSALAGG